MKKIIISFLSLLTSFVLFAQENSMSEEQFDRLFKEIQIVSSSNPDLGIKKADSLYNVSVSNVHKFKSLMLKSTAYAIKSDGVNALELAKKSLEIANKTDDYFWQAQINFAIVRLFTMTGLKSEADKHLENAYLVAKKIEDPNKSLQMQAFYYKEKAVAAYSGEHDYQKSIEYFHKERVMQDKISPKRYEQMYVNRYFIGEMFYLLKNNDSAYHYYKNANEYVKLSDRADERYKSMIELGIERTKPEINKDSIAEKAKAVLELAENINSKYMESMGYHTLAKASPSDSALLMVKSYRANADDFSMKAGLSDSYLQKTQKEKEKLSGFMIALTGVVVMLLGVLFIMIYKTRQRRKKEWKRYKELLKSLAETKEFKSMNETTPEQVVAVETEEEKGLYISEKTKQELMVKLQKFEKSNKFLDKNISLPALASIMNTNTKYLSYLLKDKRNYTFNDYIQYLRVNYIVNKLNENPSYLSYKISTLAEESGFSSHTKFTEAFKKHVGMKPSTFIEFKRTER